MTNDDDDGDDDCKTWEQQEMQPPEPGTIDVMLCDFK